MSSFLGKGWAFPPEFSAGGAQVAMVEKEEDVHQSLAILFATRPGERVMQESFGCNLDDVMFEEIDHALVGRLSSLIRDAILVHETRIELHAVDVSQDAQEAGLLQIRLDYSVLGTNSHFNMVYPFYLNEAGGR
ncbi:MAG TPA: GPW/gp25 family protein [Myxococcota bacterium]|nr:GPW/gp25 family protein [Myxococcota bacterium]